MKRKVQRPDLAGEIRCRIPTEIEVALRAEWEADRETFPELSFAQTIKKVLGAGLAALGREGGK